MQKVSLHIRTHSTRRYELAIPQTIYPMGAIRGMATHFRRARPSSRFVLRTNDVSERGFRSMALCQFHSNQIR